MKTTIINGDKSNTFIGTVIRNAQFKILLKTLHAEVKVVNHLPISIYKTQYSINITFQKLNYSRGVENIKSW